MGEYQKTTEMNAELTEEVKTNGKSDETAEKKTEGKKARAGKKRADSNHAAGEEGKKPFWKRSRKNLILSVLAVLFVLLVLVRIFAPKEEEEITPLSTVSITNPEKGDIVLETSLVAVKTAGDVYRIMPMTSGEITEIYVHAGDPVEKDGKICRIDNQKQVDAAKIQMDSAQLQIKTGQDAIELAKTNLDRMSALLATGDISRQNYEQVKQGYDQAAAGLESAKLLYESAKLQYDTQIDFSTVKSPVKGTVDSVSMTLHSNTAPGAVVAVVKTEGNGKIQFSVTDRLLSSIHVGDSVIAEKNGKEYVCKVTAAATLPNDMTGLYQIEAEITDGGEIPDGASVKVRFVSQKASDVLTVPAAGIYYDGGRTYLYTASFDDAAEVKNTVLEGNRAAIVHKYEVETGITDGSRTEILSGLPEGEPVIYTWTSQLYEGARVQVLGGGVEE